MTWAVRSLVVGQVVVALLVAWRYAPPSPAPVDLDPARFSAGRAAVVLEDVLGDGSPHPCGSVANRAVRDRIVGHFERMGYAPTIAPKMEVCHPRGGCCEVENLSVFIPGVRDDEIVALVAHYDSVAEGPGAGDDGAGVAAILEVARILADLPKPHRSIFLLLTDGEEMGLLGAKAFVSRAPEVGRIVALLNLEARGTSGPSIMFETTPGNQALVSAFARAAPRPVTNSLAATVYREMPNDTDLTVFSDAGIPGLNFAFIGGGQNYHTPNDSLENLDLGSLQQQGENALAALLSLAAGAPVDADTDAVFFDVLAAWVVTWPAPWTLPLALLGLGLLVVAWGRGRRVQSVGWRGVGLGAAWTLGGLLMTAILAGGLVVLFVRVGLIDALWQPDPRPWLGLFYALGLMPLALVGFRFGVRMTYRETWLGVWLVWGVLGVLVAAWRPGVAYLFVVPVLVAGVTALGAVTGSRFAGALGTLPAALTASLLFFPLLP
ncbi:MAG: M20/M25/M40 family metallo-hydrolase, partial [Myxococcota bacterium]|nr:M20/M25/M40 family metallo-hydrolase [Myxococcota bacterium]